MMPALSCFRFALLCPVVPHCPSLSGPLAPFFSSSGFRVASCFVPWLGSARPAPLACLSLVGLPRVQDLLSLLAPLLPTPVFLSAYPIVFCVYQFSSTPIYYSLYSSVCFSHEGFLFTPFAFVEFAQCLLSF